MATLLDSYPESNADPGEGSIRYTGVLKVGQSFEGNGKTLDSAKFFIRKNGNPPGNVVVEVFAHSGTYGSSSVGTGSVLATSDVVSASSLPSSLGLVEFLFSEAQRILLENGTQYVIVVSYSDVGSDISNDLRYVWDASSPSHAGNYLYYSEGGGWGYIAGRDLPFYVYVDSTTSKTVSETIETTESISKLPTRTIAEIASSAILFVASVAVLIPGKTRSPIIASVKNYLKKVSRISDF